MLHLAVLFFALTVPLIAIAQLTDPVPGTIPLGNLAVRVELVVELPDSGSASRPKARPMTLVGDGSGRRFVADQNGLVYQLDANGSLSVFLNLNSASDLVANQGQKGLSSIAFHPDYHQFGTSGHRKFFTVSAQTAASGAPDYPVPAGAPTSHHSVIHEWTVSSINPDAIDPLSVREILRIGQPYGDHNIAQISFVPNIAPTHPDYGMLYIAMGDGGNFGCCPRASVDPHFVGQNLASPLGKVLRIDPLVPDGGAAAYTIPTTNPFASDGDPSTLAEIWAFGLRNPHRFSWDTGGAGRMYISDIGQSNIEEINIGAIGANYGWSEREGTFLVQHDNELDVFQLPPDDHTYNYTYPVIQYDHDEGDRAVSGGYVYRGTASSRLTGEYIFGDLRSGRVFHAAESALGGNGQAAFAVLRLIDGATNQEKSLLEIIGGATPAPRADLRFGRDDSGRIYMVTKRDAAIRMIVPLAVGDINGDGSIDLRDLLLMQQALLGLQNLDAAQTFRADIYPAEGDGNLQVSDWAALQKLVVMP